MHMFGLNNYRFVAACLVIMVTAFAADAGAQPLDLLQDPANWEQKAGGEGSFRVDDGALYIGRSALEPTELLTVQDFENFELSFRYMQGRWCESGLLIHAPRNQAYRAGLEILLCDQPGSAPSPYRAGAILRHVPAKVMSINKDGEWNTVQVRMDWPRLEVRINDQVVQDIDLSDHEELRYSLRRGAIGFTNRLGWAMEVRDFQLTPLPDTEHGIALINGKDLAGWKVIGGETNWQVVDGAIQASDANGYLRNDWVGQDFDLRMYVKTTPSANGGVFFRWTTTDEWDRGHEIQILDVPGTYMTTGSIYGFDRADDLAMRPQEWELMQVFVRGAHAVSYLNGVRVSETDGLQVVRPGHIVLQMHRPDTIIQWKDMVVVPADGAPQP